MSDDRSTCRKFRITMVLEYDQKFLEPVNAREGLDQIQTYWRDRVLGPEDLAAMGRVQEVGFEDITADPNAPRHQFKPFQAGIIQGLKCTRCELVWMNRLIDLRKTVTGRDRFENVYQTRDGTELVNPKQIPPCQ